MKKVKQVFPSRNYITIDTQGDIEIVFNPVGDGTEGDDKLTFRRGRWAFRCNDFLAGKMLPNGENESMNRKIYSLNVVYDDKNGEPIIDTTYVDPTSVIPLDGSLVTIGNGNWVKKEDIQDLSNDASEILSNVEAISSDTVNIKSSVSNSLTTMDNIKLKVDDIVSIISLHTPYIRDDVGEIRDKLVKIKENIVNFNCFGIYNLTLGQFPLCKKLRCNVMVQFDNIALVFLDANCTFLKQEAGFEFRVLGCKKVVANYGNGKKSYFNNIFTSNNFFYHHSGDARTECDLLGTDDNNVFSQIYTNNGRTAMEIKLIC